MTKIVEITIAKHDPIMNLLNRIDQRIIQDNSSARFDHVAQYKDLKAEILRHAAEFYKLRDNIKETEERKESLSPVVEAPKKVMRGRLRLEEEVPMPLKSDRETSDKPS